MLRKTHKTMLERKFSYFLENYFSKQQNKILLVNGARQIGKSFIIRYVCSKLLKNYIEIDLRADSEKERLFAQVTGLDAFYMQLSAIFGNRLGAKGDTLIFLDEIQVYPQLLTLLKFLNQDGRYTFIASGSQLYLDALSAKIKSMQSNYDQTITLCNDLKQAL